MRVQETRSGKRALQDEQELSGFIELLRQNSVTRYLEVGTKCGDTFWRVMTSLPKGSVGVAVDLPSSPTNRKLLEQAVKELNHVGYSCRAYFGSSTTLATIALVRMHAPYHAALIDGDHSFEGVYADWLAYRNMATIVAFHDIVGEGCWDAASQGQVEVPKLWALLKDKHRSQEIVSPGSRMGIGVITQ